MVGFGYIVKIAKINSHKKKKTICYNCKNYFPQNTKYHLYPKINFRKNELFCATRYALQWDYYSGAN